MTKGIPGNGTTPETPTGVKIMRDSGLDKDRLSGTTMRATQEAAQVFDRVPGSREAIQQRLLDEPEYRRWLQQFGRGVLQAVG